MSWIKVRNYRHNNIRPKPSVNYAEYQKLYMRLYRQRLKETQNKKRKRR
jgi:hypothetical protein